MFRSLATLMIIFVSSALGFSQGYQNVDSKTFAELTKSGDGIILDVRTSQEYSQGHIKNSTLISTNDPQFVNKVQLLQKDNPLYIYCLTGSRSRAVANYLSKQGFTKLYNLQRGVMEWQQLGYELEKSSNVLASTNKTFSTEEFLHILQNNNLVFVDFYAPWCAPCKKMTPDVEKLTVKYNGKAEIVKVGIQENKALQTQYDVQSIPGLVLFKDGKETWRHTGELSYDEMCNVLNQYL